MQQLKSGEIRGRLLIHTIEYRSNVIIFHPRIFPNIIPENSARSWFILTGHQIERFTQLNLYAFNTLRQRDVNGKSIDKLNNKYTNR